MNRTPVEPTAPADPAGASRWRNWTTPLAIAGWLALAKLLIHFFTNGQYGYFRDELYFLACGEHVDWGYVDHAPMVAWMAWLSRALLGDSLFAIRFFPAVAGAAKVFLTGAMAHELGGGRLAVFWAGLCALAATIYLGIDSLLSMNALEPVFWMGAVWCALRAVRLDEPRYWLGFGALLGLGFMNKHSTIFFAAALVAGLLLTRARRALSSRWFWAGAVLAVVIILPNVIWEWRHDWATLELLHNVRATGKNVIHPPVEFLVQQLLIMNPLTLPVWLAGLWFFLADQAGRRHRHLGLAFLVFLGLMIVMHAKHYYVAPAYPMLFAAGGDWWAGWLDRRRALRWLKGAYPALLVAGGAALAPLVLPVLPVEAVPGYMAALGLQRLKTEVAHEGPLPQHFGDMFGWPEMVAAVARVYHGLPEAERSRACIFAGNYGEAGAIDFFGGRHGLPKAISGHQSYFLWGPRDCTGEVVILLQVSREDALDVFHRVEEAERVEHPWAMAEERLTIRVGRDPKIPLGELWPRVKHWN